MNRVIVLLLLFAGACYGQKLTVAEVQLRVNPATAEELYYSFADGDKILFKKIMEMPLMRFLF
jgi:hypothetical protein